MRQLFDIFASQVEAIKGRLYSTAYLYLGSESEALDAVDEAVFQAYRNIRKLKHPEYFNTWVTKILINVCKKNLSRRKCEVPVWDIPEQMKEEYDSLPLKEAITNLPDELRLIIVLRYFNGMTVVETSELLKIPQGTVATRQRKALSLLKLELEES